MLDAKCLTSLEIDPCDHSRRNSLSSLTDVPLPQASLTFTYWESPEARKLFVPKGDETVLESIEAQIAILRGANEMHLSYLDVIDNPLQDILDEDSLTSYQVWALQQLCLVLCVALKIAKEKMNGVTWEKCCAEAIDYASAMGMTLTSQPQTVMEWYRLFRRNRKFIRPPRKKDNLPPFLQQNPDIVQALQQYGHENLGQLSIEFMTEYVHGVVLPSMVAKEKNLPVDEIQQEEGYQTEMCKVIKNMDLPRFVQLLFTNG
jgi:hypothetical protein